MEGAVAIRELPWTQQARDEHAGVQARHKKHLADRRRFKNRKPSPAKRAETLETTKDYGRGREQFNRAANKLRRVLKFEERDAAPIIDTTSYLPPAEDEFIPQPIRSSGHNRLPRLIDLTVFDQQEVIDLDAEEPCELHCCMTDFDDIEKHEHYFDSEYEPLPSFA